MTTRPKITKIAIQLADETVVMTLEDAKHLYEELRALFGTPKPIVVERQPEYVQPYRWPPVDTVPVRWTDSTKTINCLSGNLIGD